MSGARVKPITRRRTCKGCEKLYTEPYPWHGEWPRGFCSKGCHRDKVRSAECERAPRMQIVTRAPAKPKRQTFTPASTEQRDAVRARPCLVDASHGGKVQPAHLIPRRMLAEGQEDQRAVVPLCPACHRAYDSGELDLLPWLELGFRVELGFAVERFGLISTLRKVTNDRQES